MSMKVGKGATRIVFVFNNIVIKIPSFKEWRLFLYGLLANKQELKFNKINRKDLCPVIYGSKFGFVLIMKKAKVFSNDINWSIFKNIIENKYINDYMRGFMINDLKPSNFGIYNNHLVKIDYGD